MPGKTFISVIFASICWPTLRGISPIVAADFQRDLKMKRVIDGLVSRLPVFARNACPFAWSLIWIGAVGLAALVHLAFLTAWPDHFIHEDSEGYLDQARSILTGHYINDFVHRPYGTAVFLVLLSKIFSPNILVFVTAQHVLSVVTAVLIAAIVRFSGAPRVCSLLAFIPAALFPRTIHFDNMIGSETISVFMMSLAAFTASGLAFRKWPPFLAATGIGLSLGGLMLCRSAGLGVTAVILTWLAMFVDFPWVRRLGIVALAGGIAAAMYFTPAAVNWTLGKPPAGVDWTLGKPRPGSENLAVMTFVVGYSADFDHGVQLDRKSRARQFVNEKRAANTSSGWGDDYQWPVDALNLMRIPNESDGDIDKAVRDIFIETLTTPSTLWRHLTRHFAREMFFLLFDGNYPARRTMSPEADEFFVKRDTFPIFNSPTGLESERLIYDNYAPPKTLSWLLPAASKLQHVLDRLFAAGYAPLYDPEPIFCCGLTISSEYDFEPGPIRWLSTSTLILLTLLLASKARSLSGWFPPLPRSLVAGGALMILLALVNAAFPAFLVYGFNRYGYYVTPFMAGATGILGAVLLIRIRLLALDWSSMAAVKDHKLQLSQQIIGRYFGIVFATGLVFVSLSIAAYFSYFCLKPEVSALGWILDKPDVSNHVVNIFQRAAGSLDSFLSIYDARDPSFFLILAKLYAGAGATTPFPLQITSIILFDIGAICFFFWVYVLFRDLVAAAFATAFLALSQFFLFFAGTTYTFPYEFSLFNLTMLAFVIFLKNNRPGYLAGSLIAMFMTCMNDWFYSMSSWIIMIGLWWQYRGRPRMREVAIISAPPLVAAAITTIIAMVVSGGIGHGAFQQFMTTAGWHTYPSMVKSRLEWVYNIDLHSYVIAAACAMLLLLFRRRSSAISALILLVGGLSWYYAMFQDTFLDHFAGRYSFMVVCPIFGLILSETLVTVWEALKRLISISVDAGWLDEQAGTEGRKRSVSVPQAGWAAAYTAAAAVVLFTSLNMLQPYLQNTYELIHQTRSLSRTVKSKYEVAVQDICHQHSEVTLADLEAVSKDWGLDWRPQIIAATNQLPRCPG